MDVNVGTGVTLLGIGRGFVGSIDKNEVEVLLYMGPNVNKYEINTPNDFRLVYREVVDRGRVFDISWVATLGEHND